MHPQNAVILSDSSEASRLLADSLPSTKVERCSTAEQALATLLDADPRLEMIFVDLSGVPDSIRFIEFAVGSGLTRRLPVVALVESAETTLLEAAEAVGLQHKLVKPFSPAEVQSLVQTAIAAGRPNHRALRLPMPADKT